MFLPRIIGISQTQDVSLALSALDNGEVPNYQDIELYVSGITPLSERVEVRVFQR